MYINQQDTVLSCMLPQKGNGAALSDHLRDDRHSGKWFILKEIGHICTYRFRCSQCGWKCFFAVCLWCTQFQSIRQTHKQSKDTNVAAQMNFSYLCGPVMSLFSLMVALYWLQVRHIVGGWSLTFKTSSALAVRWCGAGWLPCPFVSWSCKLCSACLAVTCPCYHAHLSLGHVSCVQLVWP